MISTGFLKLQSFKAPEWSSQLKLVPVSKCNLAMLPSPIHRWDVPGVPAGVELYIKRDDMTGMQMSGNKVRCRSLLWSTACPCASWAHDKMQPASICSMARCCAVRKCASYSWVAKGLQMGTLRTCAQAEHFSGSAALLQPTQ